MVSNASQNQKRQKKLFSLPVEIIKHNFPRLYRFGDALGRLQCLNSGFFPLEVVIPREMLEHSAYEQKKTASELILSSTKKELILKICTSFRRNGYSLYQQYRHVLDNYDERTLYNLEEPELKQILSKLAQEN